MKNDESAKTAILDENQIPELFDVNFLAEILDISKASAYQLMKREDFPVVYVTPKRRKIDKDQFLSWLDSSSQKAKIES